MELASLRISLKEAKDSLDLQALPLRENGDLLIKSITAFWAAW